MKWAIAVLIVSAACSGAAADHERLGDAAYREGRFEAALSEYQAAQKGGARSRVWAKAGAAGLRAGKYLEAVEAFRALAAEDPSRSIEAAIGLERVARAAREQGASGRQIVARAVLAIRAVDPARPLGRLAGSTVIADAQPLDAVGLLPGAIASAGTGRAVDSLLYLFAEAERATVACERAARNYRAVLRRTSDRQLAAASREGLADCAYLLGQDAINGRNGDEAERWFEAVLGLETGTRRAWLAQLGLGDARLMQGDALGAAVAYQAVLSVGSVPDSLRQEAVAKLNGLGAAPADPPTGGEA